MAIPSGSGTEVLKRHAVKSTSAGWTTIRWTQDVTTQGNTSAGGEAVPTNVILIILSISMYNNDSGGTMGFAMTQDVGSTTDLHLLSNVSTLIQPVSTYVYSDKIVLHPTDKLKVYASRSHHCIINYIKQDWT